MSIGISSEEALCINQYDLSGVSSNFGFSRKLDIKDKVCFPDPTQGPGSFPVKSRAAGPESMQISNTGYLDPAINLAAAEAALANGNAVVTKFSARAAGSKCYMFSGVPSTFEHGGQVGEFIPFKLDAANSGVVHPGLVYVFSSTDGLGVLPISANGNSPTQTTAAVVTGKTRCLHLHAITLTGTGSLVILYETSAIGDFSDAVTRHTFATVTAPNATYERAIKTAAVSDTHGRFRWTLTGTGTFLVRLCEGVK